MPTKPKHTRRRRITPHISCERFTVETHALWEQMANSIKGKFQHKTELKEDGVEEGDKQRQN